MPIDGSVRTIPTLSAYSSAVDALVVAFTNQEMNISEAYIPVQRWTRLMEEASASRGTTSLDTTGVDCEFACICFDCRF